MRRIIQEQMIEVDRREGGEGKEGPKVCDFGGSIGGCISFITFGSLFADCNDGFDSKTSDLRFLEADLVFMFLQRFL